MKMNRNPENTLRNVIYKMIRSADMTLERSMLL